MSKTILITRPNHDITTNYNGGHLRGLGEMKKNLRKMLSSENPLTDSTGIVLLWSNIRGQVLLGNPNAVI